MVIPDFPEAANSGQYLQTGSSTSKRPWLTDRAKHRAAKAFPTENTLTSVSRCHGRPPGRPAQPPQRSATTEPRTTTHTAAPTSPLSTKLAAKASRTRSNDASHLPEIGTDPLAAGSAAVLTSQSLLPPTRRAQAIAVSRSRLAFRGLAWRSPSCTPATWVQRFSTRSRLVRLRRADLVG